MLHTPTALRGMVSAPHHLGAQAGLAVLREGGNAIEAAVATAAALAVVYPHMTGLGGDGFWLVVEPGKAPISIDSCGAAAQSISAPSYRALGFAEMPRSGPAAAATVAGAVSGWQAALEISARWGGTLPLSRLFADAIDLARLGAPVSEAQIRSLGRRLDALTAVPGFADHFANAAAGDVVTRPALAETFARLGRAGLDDFYRGAIGRSMAADLVRAGSPLTGADFARHRSVRRRPLSLPLSCGTAFNLPPPTQGLASLMILGLFDRLGVREAEGVAHLHGLIEATKQAYLVRDAHIADPAGMAIHSTTYLGEALLDRIAATIAPRVAMPWPWGGEPGDTVWLGVIDGEGRAVSCIQSLAHGFGSGVVLPETGILWQNRAAAFSLDPASAKCLAPGRKPYHTLNPAAAKLKDGRLIVYGCMGGEAQPQVQAQVFSRWAMFGQGLQAAVTAPRWALGRGWNGPGSDLKMESRFDPTLVESLRRIGHPVAVVGAFDDLMGHAGAVVRHASGLLEGAADPRSDGCVAAF
ncbi:MAG: gamma-glutamyltransferase [Alphaproteobacteria bacterium]|nr:gamma-glutamyltransferase [Alphaproteobacteria bacterium]